MEAIAGGAPKSRVRISGIVRRSLLWRVMTLVVFGTLSVLVAFGVVSWLAVNESRNHALEERQALARAAAGHVDYVVRRSLEALDEVSTAEGFDLQDGDPAPEEQSLRRAYLGTLFTAGVYLIDGSGRLALGEGPSPVSQANDLSSSPAVVAALSAGRTTISGLTSSVADGAPVVSILAPVKGPDGRVQGVVLGEIGLTGSSLSEIIAPAAPGQRGYVQLIDNNGTVIASTVAGDVLQQNPHQSLVSALMADGGQAAGSCHSCHLGSAGTPESEDREEEVMALAALDAAPWAVLIRQPEAEALAPARRLEQRAVWLGIPAFAAALLLAWATVRSVAGPVRILTAEAQRLASGDLSQPVPQMGEDEIGRLAAAFETMRVHLKDALSALEGWARELETRVLERTKELEASRDHLQAVAEENAALYEEVRRKDQARGELLKKVITAQEEERRRIARELHDETSQNLTVLVMGMESDATQDAAVQQKLGRLKDLAEKTLEGVHRLVYDLRPSMLDDLGLLAGLRWYAESRLQPLGIRVSLMTTGEERRLPAELETALFRIGQEAVTNIARHSGAMNVYIGITFEPEKVTLEVEDDGEGFEPAAAQPGAPGHGWGLLGMRERAELLGGSLKVDSTPGEGTRVEVSLPVLAGG